MREILISIQPEWIVKILNGEKTIEIRKTRPSCELPVKVYIYCTHSKTMLANGKKTLPTWEDKYVCLYTIAGKRENTRNIFGSSIPFVNGKVIAEFTLNKIDKYISILRYFGKKEFVEYWDKDNNEPNYKKIGLKKEELMAWGKGKPLYGWHIEDLIIYDQPKELGEFKTTSYCFNMKNVEILENCFGKYVDQCFKNSFCRRFKNLDDFGTCGKTGKKLTRAPQSWCYVEGAR